MLSAVMLAACSPANTASTVGARPAASVTGPSSSPSFAGSAGPTAPPSASADASPQLVPATPTPSTPMTTLHPPVGTGLHWKPRGRKIGGQHAVEVALTDSDRIGLMWMNPDLLRFRYIPGTSYPEGSPKRPQDRRPSTWVPRMVAAFNGAFHLKDHAGGYYYDGTNVRPLQPGLAAFTIDNGGHMSVRVWKSHTSIAPGTVVVRQNLPPLVQGGKSQATSHDGRAKWGLANGGLATANRTAVGQLADGSLVFAYGSEVTADALAAALVKAGVRTAVTLDMNKSWPTGFYYDAPQGGHAPVGHKIQPRIWRDPSTYNVEFKKDFVVALARHS
jgi:hypothetical protein